MIKRRHSFNLAPPRSQRRHSDVLPRHKRGRRDRSRRSIPFTAGSTVDIVGRIVLDPLAAQLGQPIVVENRGGAGGTIGSAVVAKADPDGYTLLINASAHSAAPAAYPNAAYDTEKDFSAVASFGSVPNVMVIAPSKGIKTVQELAAARQVRRR